MLAAPALRAAAGKLHFQHRRGITEHTIADGADTLLDEIGQLLQPGTHHFVVIPPPGIQRNHRFTRLLQPLQRPLAPVRRRGSRQIIHACGDDTQRSRNQFGRTRALEAVRLHVVHAAVKALLQPGLQARLGVAQVHAGHADVAKSQRRRSFADGGQ